MNIPLTVLVTFFAGMGAGLGMHFFPVWAIWFILIRCFIKKIVLNVFEFFLVFNIRNHHLIKIDRRASSS